MARESTFRVMLYGIPAAMDCVMGIFSFIGPVRAAILGYDPLIAGSMVAARAIFKFLFGFVVAWYLKPHNAPAILIGSFVVMIGVCLLGLFATNVTMLYVTSGLSGVCSASYSASFQLYMTIVDKKETRPLIKTIGTFTMSWSAGMAFGPFITGFLMELGRPADGLGESIGWVYTYLAAAFLSTLALIVMSWIIKQSSQTMRRHLDALKARMASGESHDGPDFAWLGWVMATVGIMTLGMARGVFPAGVTQAGMPEWRSGLIMTVQTLAITLAAFFLGRHSKWLYSGPGMFVIGLVGSVGLALHALPLFLGLGELDMVWPYYVASVLFGGYIGVVYIYSGFHSLIHPFRSGRYIALNETLGAMGMTAGPLLGGWLASRYGFFYPFVIFAGATLLVAVFQWVVYYGAAKRAKGRRS